MNRKALLDNDRLLCQTSDPTLSEEATTSSSLEQRAVRRDLWLPAWCQWKYSTVVLIVTHYCVTVIIVRLALATARRSSERRRLGDGASEDVTKLSEAHGASRDRLSRLCRCRFRLCLCGSLRRLGIAIRLARAYQLEVVIFETTRFITA